MGKTTLFHHLAGVEPPDSGKVFLDGEDITGQSGKVGYMLQKDLLFEHKTTMDNVILPFIISGMDKKKAREKALPYFPQFGIEGYEDKYPYQLSGGMRQRAALLRTFFMGSPVTLLDEPFSALDAITKTQMHKWYIDIVEKLGTTTLFITHDIDEALYLSNRIYILAGYPGKITRVIENTPVSQNADMLLSKEYLNKKQEIMQMIT